MFISRSVWLSSVVYALNKPLRMLLLFVDNVYFQRCLTHGEADEGSERLVTFEANKKVMMDTVLKIIRACREEGGDAKENPPFIDSMLLNYVSDKTVS